MRKTLILILAVGLVLAYGCGGSGDGERGMSAQQSGGNPQGEKRDGGRPGGKPGQKPGGKQGEELDVDSLDIPQQMKDAIKSGRIPADKVQEYLANAKRGASRGGGDGEAAPVSVDLVKRQSLNSYLVLNGVVEPERKVEIFSRLSAYVRSIVKEEGDYVKENTVLALLDDTEIRIGYEQAKIQLEQAKLTLEEAEKNFVRNQELIKRELISEQEFQTQQAEFEQRKLDYANRQESFKDLQLQLNYTQIRSLSDGYITERLIEVGDRVIALGRRNEDGDFVARVVGVPKGRRLSLETRVMPLDLTQGMPSGELIH